MNTVDDERVKTLRALNEELRSHCARLEYMIRQRDDFLKALCDPDIFGYAVNNEIRGHAYRLLRSTHF